jgi:AraC-like DNA-binding protein
MPEGATQQILPTVIGFASRLAIAALEERKVDAAPLLKRAGLSAGVLAMPQKRISAASQGKFLEYAAEAADDSAFGLHLAESANPRITGLLFYAMSAAKTLGEALKLLARYSRIVNDSVRLKLERRGDGVVAEISYVGLSRHQARQFTEFGVAHTLRCFREIAGQNVRPDRVSCGHLRNADIREFERYYGCEVEFAALADLVIFSNETLSTPLITHDDHLLETLRPFCEEAAKARRIASGTLRVSVENEIQRLLPHGQAQAETVAKSLALSVRTLSRRLADEGTSFAEVVDQLRRSLALQYLKEPGFSLAQIAYFLGYEGTTSFNHAFKRWTGKAPSAARKLAAEALLPA